jgi:hypothetical protein
MSTTSLLLFLCISFAGIKPGKQAEEGWSPERWGNLTVPSPVQHRLIREQVRAAWVDDDTTSNVAWLFSSIRTRKNHFHY